MECFNCGHRCSAQTCEKYPGYDARDYFDVFTELRWAISECDKFTQQISQEHELYLAERCCRIDAEKQCNKYLELAEELKNRVLGSEEYAKHSRERAEKAEAERDGLATQVEKMRVVVEAARRQIKDPMSNNSFELIDAVKSLNKRR